MATCGLVRLVHTQPVEAVAMGVRYLGRQVPRHDEIQPTTAADQEEAYLAHVLVRF